MNDATCAIARVGAYRTREPRSAVIGPVQPAALKAQLKSAWLYFILCAAYFLVSKSASFCRPGCLVASSGRRDPIQETIMLQFVLSHALLAVALVEGAAAPPIVAAPIVRQQVKPESKAGQTFIVECVSITQLQGAESSFSFRCKAAAGDQSQIRVVRTQDLSGEYPDPGKYTPQPEADLYRLSAIAPVVQTFVLLKQAAPASTMRLKVHGSYSKLPAANEAMVATAVTIDF